MQKTWMRPVAPLAALALVGALGCQGLREGVEGEDRTTTTTAIGGAVGAATGAALHGENRIVGALIGGALGAGGGYLIGAETDWFRGDNGDVDEEAREAVERAQSDPADVEDVYGAETADLNQDGFVTMDELIAMERADLSDAQMLERLRATDQVFDLTEEQRETLIDRGVSPVVVAQLDNINREERDRLLGEEDTGVISSPRS